VISPAEFRTLQLRVHSLLADVPLHDVWAVDLPHVRAGITLDEFHRRMRAANKTEKLSGPAHVLVRLRRVLGRIFRLDGEQTGPAAPSFAKRLTVDDQAQSSVPAGAPDGPLRVVYRFKNELLLELANRTVHAAALSALTEMPDKYRYYFAVYVRKIGWITPLYMALIDPFRRWIVYPAMLKRIRATWTEVIP
jgi:hypothetical protein